MKRLASIVGLLIAGFGLFGVLAPARVLGTAQSWLSPIGLYAVAVVRLLAGVALLGAAPKTRASTVVRILGVFFVLNGIVTAFLGLQRAEALLAWASNQNTSLIRLGAAVAIAVGAFVFYAASSPDGSTRGRIRAAS